MARCLLDCTDKRDVHEWSIMRDCCYSITDADLQEELLRVIHASKAFSHFKDIVYAGSTYPIGRLH